MEARVINGDIDILFKELNDVPDIVMQEEFLNSHGMIEHRYLHTYGIITTAEYCNTKANLYFGKAKWDKQPYRNEVSEAEFFEHYKFAKFSNVRRWISYFYKKTGKILGRKHLYSYLLGATPQ